jgi:hypothetical protein
METLQALAAERHAWITALQRLIDAYPEWR